MTKIFATLPAIVISLAIVEPQTTTPPRAESEQALIANERALLQAVARADAAAFQALVAPEGVWTTREGFVPMKLLGGALGTFELRKWDIANPRVTWLADDAAVVIYTWIGAGAYGGRAIPGTMLASTSWSRRNGKWVAAHHHESELVGQ